MSEQRGFSLIELMVSMIVLMVCVSGAAKMTIESSRINRSEQLLAQTQDNARNSMAIIVQKLRSAGWDPLNAGLPMVAWDSNPSDDVSEIEVFADLDGDGLTTSLDEQVLIRHTGNRIVWRRSSGSATFEVVAANITNDADGDGTIEPMFVPLVGMSLAADRVLVQITASSPRPDPMTGEFIRYTVRSEVALRKTI